MRAWQLVWQTFVSGMVVTVGWLVVTIGEDRDVAIRLGRSQTWLRTVLRYMMVITIRSRILLERCACTALAMVAAAGCILQLAVFWYRIQIMTLVAGTVGLAQMVAFVL